MPPTICHLTPYATFADEIDDESSFSATRFGRVHAPGPTSATSAHTPSGGPGARRLRVRGVRGVHAQGAMMDRWNAVRDEVAEEERLDAEEDAEPSLEQLEERKRKRIADWRNGVEGTDAAERNNNFVAIGGDWRERVRMAKQRREEQGNGRSAAAQ